MQQCSTYRKPNFWRFRGGIDRVTGCSSFGKQLSFGLLQESSPWLLLLPSLLAFWCTGLQPPALQQCLHIFCNLGIGRESVLAEYQMQACWDHSTVNCLLTECCLFYCQIITWPCFPPAPPNTTHKRPLKTFSIKHMWPTSS